MHLTHFIISNFRSVNESGEIKVDQTTSLVGRNESGKSNLLLALTTLNPPGGRKALSKIKDFPRGRRLEECTPETQVVESTWALSDEERKEIRKLLDFGQPITAVKIGRGYAADIWVELEGLEAPVVAKGDIEPILRRLAPVLVQNTIAPLAEPHKATAEAAWQRICDATTAMSDGKVWAKEAVAGAAALRKSLGAASAILDAGQDALLAEIEAKAKLIDGFGAAQAAADKLVAGWLPTFIYVSEFPELYGHQNLEQFINHRGEDPTKKEAESNFAKLAKVADFDPAFLHKNREDHETRGQLLNRAGALVSAEIRRLWKDRALTVRFNLDGVHLDILVADPNSDYPVEINLDERSRGFKWFFSFYVTFSADTQGGSATGAILLLDEPGLYLHAISQAALLKHLREDYENQIIYTTHSPFMVPPDAIEIVRTVNIDPESGTTVTNSPTGDTKTLFPLQAALGYHLSQTLFVGSSNCVVEGVTDFWILSAVNAHFASSGSGLPSELVITPAGGAPKISYMTALLASEELKVLVLLDDDKAGRDTQKELLTTKLLRDAAIMFVSAAFETPPSEADIEDVLDAAVYEKLVRETYAKELKGKKLSLNAQVPRIAKRFEQAFEAVGIPFNKTRPARQFLTLMGSDPASVLTPESEARFKRLLAEIGNRYAKIKAADRSAFT